MNGARTAGVAGRLALSILLAGWGACVQAGVPSTQAPVYGYRVTARFPHDPDAFTQGLIHTDGQLVESTGRYGQSSLRQVELQTGQVRRQVRLPDGVFGEGLTRWGDRLVVLTWREGLGLIYDLASLRPLTRFAIPGEGWGLTQDGRHWILSDGSAMLSFLDPETQAVAWRVPVHDGARPIDRLNELEYVEGALWANVWREDYLVRIAPRTGEVTAYLDLTDLWPPATRTRGADVLNGIAWDASNRRLLVTGKCWPWLYQIELLPPD